MLTIIKKISNEINEKNRPDVIETFKEVLVDGFELTAQEKTFYSLPLELIFDVISKVDFSSFECDASLLKTIVKNTVSSYPNIKETLYLLHFIKANCIPLTLNDCVGVLSLFDNSELCIRLGELYDEIDSPSLEVDYDIKLKEKEEEIKSLQFLVNNLKEPNEKHKDGSPNDLNPKKPEDFERNIFIAAKGGKLSSIQYLIEKEDVNINKKAVNNYDKQLIKKGDSVLHIACFNNHLPIVEYLIKKGAEIDIKDSNGKTPLHIACEKGYLPIVEYLLDKDSDIEAKDNEETTPLHFACRFGHLQAVQCLIEKGADIEAKDCIQQSPLYYASINGISLMF